MTKQKPLNLNGTTIERVPHPLDPQRPNQYRVKSGGGGGAGAFGLLLLIVFPLAILAGVCWVLYHTVKWAFAPGGGYRPLVFLATVVASIIVIAVHVPALLTVLPLPLFFMWMFGVNDDVAVARRHIDREQKAIDRAMQANPADPTLTRRIEKLTAEVERVDRIVVQAIDDRKQTRKANLTEAQRRREEGKNWL